MRRPITWFILLAVLAAGCEGQRLPWQRESSQRPAPVAPVAPQVAAIPDVLTVPPKKMRWALAEAYRLRPDRRFLLAVADVHHLMTSQPRATAAVEFREGRWHVSYRDVSVGTLPPFPNFPDLTAVLSNWVQRLNGQFPLPLASDASAPLPGEIENQISGFAAPNLVAALRQVDRLWNAGKRQPALLASATRALVLLSLQSLDRVQMGDTVPAKGLALLALTRTLTDRDTAREEGLLAQAMGYTRHAQMAAASLPPSDAVRLFLAGDGQGLKALAEGNHATIEARYLWMARLADRKEVNQFYAFRESFFQHPGLILPSLKAGLDMHDFGSNISLSTAVPKVVLAELARELGKPAEGWKEALARRLQSALIAGVYLIDSLSRRAFGLEPPGPAALVHSIAGQIAALSAWLLEPNLAMVINRFESEVEKAAEESRGPFLDEETHRAYFRAFFYSGLFVRGLHYLDYLSSVEAVRGFAGQLGNAGHGAPGDFQRWYRHLADSKEGSADARLFLEDLAGLPHLGAPALRRTFTELQDRVPYGDPVSFAAAKRLVLRMDTRVEHRMSLSTVAHRGLRDLALFETLYRSAIEAGQFGYQQVWYANFTGNQTALMELLRSPEAKAETRAEILGHLEKFGVAGETLRAEYRQLIAEDPGSWKTRSKYVDHLERIKAHAEAREVIEEWLDEYEESSTGFDSIHAHTALARVYYREGRYEEGWAAIEPVVSSWQGGALERAARLLNKLGRKDEAEEMGRRAVGRYPDEPRIRTALAELYWTNGKHVEAAKLLTTASHKLSATDWSYTVAPGFARVFKDRPEDALAAFRVLLAEHIDSMHLKKLGVVIAKEGRHEVAFRMLSQLRSHGGEEVELVLETYRNYKAWKGKEVALAWLKKSFPAQLHNRGSQIVFWAKEYDLLWDLIENPEQGSHAQLVWLMRAAAAMTQGPGKDLHREKLLTYYANSGGDHYHALGRFLLGLATEQEVLSLATDPVKRCQIAFYIGLRAKTEGRYVDASDWLRVAVETGQNNNEEYNQAYHDLHWWVNEGKSLSRLAAEES